VTIFFTIPQFSILHTCISGVNFMSYNTMRMSSTCFFFSIAGTTVTKHTILLGAISCLFSLESSTGL
jgi:hypothetical protein